MVDFVIYTEANGKEVFMYVCVFGGCKIFFFEIYFIVVLICIFISPFESSSSIVALESVDSLT